MLSSDNNLTTAEYVKYFVTDPDTIRHFEQCLDTIEYLNGEYTESLCRIDDLEHDIAELQDNKD